MSPRASTTAKRAQQARANRITDDQPSTDARASWATSPATRKAMQANRRRDTAPEMAIRRLVHAAGLRYRVDARPLPTARHTADMIFTRARVAVFVDGCWWHGCPAHYRPPSSNVSYWAAKISRNQERDKLVDQALIEANWTVIRIWEHEAPASAAHHIESAVRRNITKIDNFANSDPVI
jgi:DNA mismatch endonuclease, patch repair protein